MSQKEQMPAKCEQDESKYPFSLPNYDWDILPPTLPEMVTLITSIPKEPERMVSECLLPPLQWPKIHISCSQRDVWEGFTNQLPVIFHRAGWGGDGFFTPFYNLNQKSLSQGSSWHHKKTAKSSRWHLTLTMTSQISTGKNASIDRFLWQKQQNRFLLMYIGLTGSQINLSIVSDIYLCAISKWNGAEEGKLEKQLIVSVMIRD